MASLPYPRRPLRGCSGLRCTNRALVHQHCNPPTESTEHTEASGGEEPPTDFTDAHRWLGCVRFCGFYGKIVWCLRGYGRDAIPSYNCTYWGAKILRVLCNPWENISVRNICAHLCHLWEDISARGVCGFCEFCGRICAVCLVGAVETTAPPCRVQKVH